MSNLHTTAIIHADAKLHPSVVVGPYAIIESDVEIDQGCIIDSHAHIYRGSRLGKDNRLCHGAMLGCEPQDFSFEPNNSKPLVIGDGNHFKEGVHISRGVKTNAGTLIGHRNYFMGNFHVGHDSIIGNDNILGHGAGLAGHVVVGDHVNLAPMAAVHQFVHIGDRVMVAGLSKVVKDIPPFSICDGNPARVVGINSIGLRRAGFSPQSRSAIKQVYKVLYHSGLNTSQAMEQLSGQDLDPEAAKVVYFFEQSQRGVTRHR